MWMCFYLYIAYVFTSTKILKNIIWCRLLYDYIFWWFVIIIYVVKLYRQIDHRTVSVGSFVISCFVFWHIKLDLKRRHHKL